MTIISIGMISISFNTPITPSYTIDTWSYKWGNENTYHHFQKYNMPKHRRGNNLLYMKTILPQKLYNNPVLYLERVMITLF